MSCVKVAVESTWTCQGSSWTQRTVKSVVAHSWLGWSDGAVVSKWTLFAHIFVERTDLVLESSSWARLRLDCSFHAEVAFGTIESSQICQSCSIAVVSRCTVVAIVLVELLSLWVPGANFALILSFGIKHAISNRRTVVTHWTFIGRVVPNRTEVAWLATSALVNLSGCLDYTLSFEGAIDSPVVSFRTVEAGGALFTWRVWLNCVVVFGTQISSSTLIGNQVSAAVVGGGADGAVCICLVKVSATRTKRLPLNTTWTERSRDAIYRLNSCNFVAELTHRASVASS